MEYIPAYDDVMKYAPYALLLPLLIACGIIYILYRDLYKLRDNVQQALTEQNTSIQDVDTKLSAVINALTVKQPTPVPVHTPKPILKRVEEHVPVEEEEDVVDCNDGVCMIRRTGDRATVD